MHGNESLDQTLAEAEAAVKARLTPPLRKKGPWRSRWTAGTCASAVLLALGWGGQRHFQRKAAAAERKKLIAATVLKGEFVVMTQAAGVAEPRRKVTVMPIIGGRIEKVLVQEGDRVVAGHIVAWMSSTDRSAVLDAAHAQGLDQFKKWQDAYKPTPIVAPIDGSVIKRAIEPGQTVTTNSELLTLSDQLIVKTFVDERDIGRMRGGQQAEFVLDAYPKERHRGKVIEIASDSTLQNNVTVYAVKLQPMTGAARLRSGMTAEVHIEVERKRDALYVPKRAIKYKESGTVVMLGKDTETPPVERSVSIGVSNEKFTEILSGLSAGDALLMPASTVPDEDAHVIEVN